MRICGRSSLFLLGLGWWSALFLIQFSTIGSGSFSPEVSVEGSWPLSSDTYTDDFDRTAAKGEGTFVINSSHETLQEGADLLEASIPLNPSLRVPNKPQSKPNKAPSLLSFSPVNRNRLSLWLFLFVIACGLRAAWLTREACAPEKVPHPEGEGLPPFHQRIEKVKELLPAAQRLAATIDSNAALELLADAKESLNILLSSPQAEREREGSPDGLRNLNKALGALRGLHEMAMQQAEGLMKEEEQYISKRPFLELDAWEEGVRDLVAELQRVPAVKEIEPFLTSFRSVGESIERLTKRMKAVGVRVRRHRKFEDERDGEDRLVEAANYLGWIYSTTEMRRKQVELLEQIQESSLSVVKSFLVAERQAETWELDEHLGYLCMRAALAREKLSAGDNSNHSDDNSIISLVDEDSSTSPAMVKGRLNVIGRCINEIVYLAGELQIQEQALKRTSTLEDLLTVNSTIMELQERAAIVIEKGTAEAEHLPSPGTTLSDQEKKALEGPLAWVKKAVAAENRGFQLAVEQTNELAEHLMKVPGYEGSPFVEQQAEVVAKIAEGTAKREKNMVKSVAQLGEAGKFEAVQKHFKKTIGDLQATSVDREALRVVGQGFVLTELLLNDISNLEIETNRAARDKGESEGETGTEERQFEELRRHLNGAKEKAKKAVTLEEVADAASYFRAFAIAIQDLSFISKDTKKSLL